MKALWSLSKIGELDFASPSGFMKVKDFLPQVIEEVTQDISGQYAILKQSMIENGQTAPLFISNDRQRLRDGIHRIALASVLGWETMFVSSIRTENPWDETEQGQEYWRLWNLRLEGFRGSR